MIRRILLLRIEQFIRILNEVGVIRAILVFPFFFLIYGTLGEFLQKNTDWYIGLFLASSWISTQLFRKDKEFLKKIYPRPFFIYWAEYGSGSLLIGLLYARTMHFSIFGTMMLVSVIAAAIPYTVKLQSNYPLFTFPSWMKGDFEWISGIRKNAYWLIPTYLLGLGLSFYTVAVPVALLLLSIGIAMFYTETTESAVFVTIFKKTPERFIRHKVMRSLTLFWGATLPLTIGFFIFHATYWYIFLVVLLICSLIQLSTIVLKYAMYQPNINMQQNGMILGFLIACWMFPFMQPVPLIMTSIYYRKAIVNLKNYIR